jgi:hypothetical protein
VAKDASIDTVLVGGSTSTNVTPDMMKLIPGVTNAFNLSYEGSLPYDRAAVTTEILKYSHARRVILAFDYFYALGKEQTRPNFPFYLYDGDPLNDTRMVGSTTFWMAANALLHHGALPGGGGKLLEAKHELRYQAFQSPGEMKAIAREVVRYRGDVDRPATKTCSDFTAVNDQLLPFARTLSQRHVALDVYIPPYALIAPYDWQNGEMRGELGESLFNDQLMLRRCMVEALDGIPGVRIFAFDNEDWITADLVNYRDSSHAYSEKVTRFMMQAMGQGTHRLTKDDVEAYLATLHARVLAAKVYNSKVSFTP